MDFTEEEFAEFFEYLDELRGSGETNMFGAGSYLVDAFDMGRADSRRVLSAWMKSFDKDKSAAVRAKEALAVA